MDREADSVYGLVGRLCESIYHTNRQKSYDDDENAQEEEKHLKRLRARAYEILLNKSDKDEGQHDEPCEPIMDLLKHAYILRVGAGRISQANELEEYLDEFIDGKLQEEDPVAYSILQFLSSLKSLESIDDTSLNIFYYDRPHPQLPEMVCGKSSVPPFQVYPVESFHLPKKFEAMLKQDKGNIISYDGIEPGNKLVLLDRFASCTSIIPSIRYRGNTNSSTSISSKDTIQSLKEMNFMSDYFLPQIRGIESPDEYLQINREGIVEEPETPLQAKDPLQMFAENGFAIQKHDMDICEIEEDFEETSPVNNLDKMWENMDKLGPISSYRTWETLGDSNPSKELPFASELVDATLHIINVAQDNLLMNYIPEVNVISYKQFIDDIKVLLLGVESSTFLYNPMNGFELKKNSAIHGISSSTLENMCYEVTFWGTCFKNLSDMVTPDPETGKLQIEGLIFKALCGSIKEFLLFYHAAILRVTTLISSKNGLLEVLDKLRPLGNLIAKVAQLCRCDRHKTTLGEGIGILTHIYKEVTRVTEKNVALVFYSILKDCCEVYFRFLQHWIFKGACADIYEEFMIVARPQYLRTRTHRFWTRAFIINPNLVPGFLADLVNPILQCGKAITLLKICDPKNPLIRLSVSSQPPVHVCLNVAMLQDQARFYEDYAARGEAERGEQLTLSSAIQSLKEAERKRAALVIAAQQVTLLRLKKEREDELKKIAKDKLDLLEELKDQAEQAALRKERDRKSELLEDKRILEEYLKIENEAIRQENVGKENNLRYYKELAEEIENRRRIREESACKDNHDAPETKTDDSEVVKSDEKITDEITEKPKIIIDDLEDTKNVNSDSAPIEEASPATVEVAADEENKSSIVSPSNKAVRPTVLDINSVTNRNIEAKRNKLKVLESEFGFVEPAADIPWTKLNMDSLTEAQKNRLKILDTEFGLSPVKETAQVRPKIEDDDLTDAQRNKLKILQNEFGFEEEDTKFVKQETDLDNLTDAQRNKIKVLGTEYNLENVKEDAKPPIDLDNLTDAQRNRMKILQNEYGFGDPIINTNPTLDLDNLTDAQKNRLKVLNSEYGIFTPNNNEQIIIQNVTDISKMTISEINRIKNMAHNDWNELVVNKKLNNPSGKTEIQLNWNEHEPVETPELTEAQQNRNRVMSTVFDLPAMNDENKPRGNNVSLTDCQKNRNRNMAHNFEYDYNAHTPMSTATDMFTISTHSGSAQEPHSCANTPFSEITNHSELLCAQSSDASGLTDEVSRNSFRSDSKGIFHDMSPAFPQFIGLASMPSTPADALGEYQPPQHEQQKQLTSADIEMINSTSLQVFLEKSIVVPLSVQSRLVNDAIVKYLLTEHSMLSHLHSLRSYYFLLNGEFGKSLTQSLFTRLYQVESPVELFNSSILSNFLEKALVSSLSGTYANSELLSLSASDLPDTLQTSNPEALSSLSLNYKISWPLNIIFNDMVMQQYSKVFKFLLMVGRVLWVLQEDFHILKVERKASCAKQHHKLQLFRHSMMQFMNALHTYLTCGVLHASWAEFERELEQAHTLDEINDKHVAYLKKILSRCMLNQRGEKMRTCLTNIFKVVLKFHNRIRSRQQSTHTASSYENLERMYLAFCEQRAFLAHVAEKLAQAGYQPHLMQFLHALNINPRYELAVKK
ncbi:gamma-tubulin complex component 6 [Trichogramma pretiosum]|uniref:gamma-tubulin complex component 6 n=1 Tax=Trichogramma pretiosum TaxID=7493 RepID=UPI0006C96AF0|nr:gamma-tubulin complex component 6 [Trichogramma pretiosum]